MLDYYNDYASYYGCSLDEFIAQATDYDTREALIAGSADTLEEHARYYLITQALAEDAGIEADDAALSDYFEEHMGSSDYSSYITTYGEPYLRFVVLNELVRARLSANTVNG